GTSFTNGRQPFTVSFGTGAPVSATRADNQTLAATTPTHTAGTVDVIVTGNAGQGNATSVTLTNGFTFTRLDQAAVTISAPGNAAATGPGGLNVAVTPVTYTSNTNVGTASASATYGGDANHLGSTGTGSFSIGQAASTTTVSCPVGPYTYDGTAHTPCSATV